MTATKQGVGGDGLKGLGKEIASKTGTSTYDYAAMKAKGVPDSASADNWVITYSPEYVISFWYGVDALDTKVYTKALDAAIERKKISDVLGKKIYSSNAKFSKPSGIISAKYELETNPAQLPCEYTPSSLISTELFKKGTEPSEVSDRFSQLKNPSDGQASVSGTQVNLSWSEIATPNAINSSYLQNYFSENYGQFASMYLSRRNSYNNKNIGTIGYQVYLETTAGLQSLGYTPNPYYVYNAPTSGTYTFVVKSAYSIFKANMSSGLSITANVSGGVVPSTPTPEEPTENPDNNATEGNPGGDTGTENSGNLN